MLIMLYSISLRNPDANRISEMYLWSPFLNSAPSSMKLSICLVSGWFRLALLSGHTIDLHELLRLFIHWDSSALGLSSSVARHIVKGMVTHLHRRLHQEPKPGWAAPL